LAGGLALTCTQSMVDLLVKLSAMGQPTKSTQPSIPPGPVIE